MDCKYEQEKYGQGYKLVIGCDEVGRGCLAGPVVAAAVAFATASLKLEVESYKEIKDSKLLLPKKREELSDLIKQNCVAYGIGEVAPEVIDEINIHQATLLAMRKAVDALTNAIPADALSQDDDIKLLLAVDGKFVPYKTVDGKIGLRDRRFDMQQEAVIKGDNKILSVAAASIVAKVYRDDLMRKLHKKHPAYNFAQHKGYATLHHRQMISKYGLSKLHRLSFCKNIEIKAT